MSEWPTENTELIDEQELYDDWVSHPIRIGDYLINFNDKTVTTPTKEVRNITPNSIRLLLLLLHNANTYVSLQDIHKFIYGNQYKDDSSTRKQVTALRKLFDDTDKEKRFIENKLGHGYRLVAPVDFIEDEKQRRSRDKYYWAAGAALFSLGVAVVLGWWWTAKQLASQNYIEQSDDYARPVPVSHFKGIENYPSISDDQRWLLFNHKPEGKDLWQIYVRDMVSGELTQLSIDSSYERIPKWSYGHTFVFSRFDGNDCHFYAADFSPLTKKVSNERKLVECSKKSPNAQGHMWEDGTGMYFNRANSVNDPFVIYSYSFATQKSWPIASPPPSGKGDYFFSVSENGKYLAVLRNKNWSQTEVWMYDTTTWETELIDTVNAVLHTVEWVVNQSIVYRNDFNEIMKYDLKDRKRNVVLRPALPVYAPLLLKSEDIIYTSGSYFKSDLVKHDLQHSKVTKVESSSYDDFLPAVSRDGQSLAWVSNRTGVFQIWFKSEGKKALPLTNLKRNLKFTDLSISPNGQFVGGTTNGKWFIIEINSREILWSDSELYYKNFQWRHDSQSAYLAVKHMEQWKQVIVDINGQYSEPKNLPTDAFIVAEVSESLHYVASFQTNGFWRVKADNGKEQSFFETDQTINKTGRWCVTDKAIYYIQGDKVLRLGHEEQEPIEIENKLVGSRITLPNDESWFISTQTIEGEVDLIEQVKIRSN
ncbi:MAG: PD40 domain-containing protein [Gammaproteobacteria bacterium]|nr:PD40 domain-containing protein [Gammaproteobacteria bacterium]